jgi:poly-beta-1,6-N-acetyl-D-glucosamine synthase
MTNAVIFSVFQAFGVVIFFLGMQGMVFLPLTIAYEVWKKRFLRSVPPFDGTVTVLVPAYNEEKTIRASIASILASDYPKLEVIVINDGSTDGTEDAISDLIKEGSIRYIRKANGGKASALNAGIEAASGEIVVFTDADSLFLPDTIKKMVRWFAAPSIDAVCGNDAPLHPSTPVQKFLAVTTHIGTGFVRRALALMRCLPIITGNLGAVRTRVLREIKGFREIWGEDLEITFRLHKSGKRIVFDPEPKVMAECPGTLAGLWKQRVRWIRSYIKITFLHRDLFFNPRFSPFSFYLPVNFMNMAVLPLLQIVMLVLIPWAYLSGHLYFSGTIEVLSYLGVTFFFLIAVWSIAIDMDFNDLVYLPYGLLILPLSYFYNMVAAYSWWKELTGAEERWAKIERRKIIPGRKKRWEYVLAGTCLVAVPLAVLYYYTGVSGHRMARYQVSTYYWGKVKRAPRSNEMSLGVSTHFDAWSDWRKAISNVLERGDIGLSEVVGVSAGRPDWAYFKWKGHGPDWSNHQKGAREDLLLTASSAFHRAGFKVAALVDIFGPRYIKDHPGTGAVGFDGKVNGEQPGFMEVVEGDYGKRLDWPRTRNGRVDRDDPSIWEWRSALMEGFIKKAAEIAHRRHKKLYVDVPISWADFRRNGKDSGLDYRRVLRHADNIVVWNYFYLEGKSPKVSEAISRYLVENLPRDSFYVSLGLWGKKDPMDPRTLSQGLTNAIRGGAKRIWITPDSLVTEEHWDEVRSALGGKRR